MKKVHHELAINHQRAHSMPVGPFYHSNPYSQSKELLNTTTIPNKRRHPISIEDGLLFNLTQVHVPLYQQDQSTLCQVELKCKVDRGFFLCEEHWTCYRRNYFQLTTTFTTHCNENQPFYIQPQQQKQQQQQPTPPTEGEFSHNNNNNNSTDSLVPVQAFYIQLAASASDGNKGVGLIQLTAKRDKGPQQVPCMQPIQPGGGLPLHYPHDNSQRTVTYERLQFKSATANNGKKRATQQFFYLTVQLIAQDINQCHHIIATSQSAPLVVRGRSPGHYADTEQRIQRHPYTKSSTKIKRKKENQQQTSENDIHVSIPPSPSSLSPIPMPVINSAIDTASSKQTSFIQHHHPTQNQSATLPPTTTSPSTSSTNTTRSISSSSLSSTSSTIIPPTIPSDASSSSMFYMNDLPTSFNPHGRSFSANDSAWHLRQQHLNSHHSQHRSTQQLQDTWSGIHLMTPSWEDRHRTDSTATFGSYVTQEESIMSPPPSSYRTDFHSSSPSPTTSGTQTLTHPIQQGISSQQSAFSSTTLSSKSITDDYRRERTCDNDNEQHHTTDLSTTYVLYPNTPWDARQHGQLTDYNQEENKQ
ncbi:uncharacterized protein BX664DRAFT_360800 [Halteromyces radiatus]|uniref:uncharacterized protein n=1 Tax=Halteromyces radiatus TaxID=101107 RepID=UPI00221FD039|nr:uncharacterized protein BX664DRAFT_360800 [Halteromyces radiatus]KAI8085006.1 hypothetical protein BX664DRAFT_360800 [Halteromyces radiatus]